MPMRTRTEEDILAYLRRTAVNGKLAKSLLEIAKEVGYSNATVQRVLKRLEAQDLVSVDRDNRKANQPAVITYLGTQSDDEILEEGTRLANNLKSAADELLQFFQRTKSTMKHTIEEAAKWKEVEQNLVSVTDTPQGLKVMTLGSQPARHIS